MSPIKVFVSYSHYDELWLIDKSSKCLIPFFKRLFVNKVEFWYDLELSRRHPGAKYKQKIEQEISKSTYALLLISNNFVSSRFIEEFEIVQIKNLFDEGKIEIIPILIGAVDLNRYKKFRWLLDTQILPSVTDPLINYTESEVDWDRIKNELVSTLWNKFFDSEQPEEEVSEEPEEEIIKVNTVPPEAGNSIFLTDVPHKGGGPKRLEIISGKISGNNLKELKIVIYSYADGSWWVQPTVENPFTEIKKDGTWTNSIHLGLQYAVLLVKKDFNPVNKINSLPEIEGNVIAKEINKARKKPVFSILFIMISLGLLLFVSGVTIYYLSNRDNPLNKEIGIDPLIINHIPIFDSLGGDEKMDFISGSVKQGFLQDNCIAVYAYTNMWYIQPLDSSPLTPINNDGTWEIQTHLGSKYCIMLVKKTYTPPKLLTNLPLTNNEIINMQIISKTE